MDALFIVPTLVSPQVNEKMIPALAKMIERNIILNNSSLFKEAALAKYSRYTTWNKVSEDTIPVTILSQNVISEGMQFDKFGDIVLFEADKAKDYYLGNDWTTDAKRYQDKIERLELVLYSTKDLKRRRELNREIDQQRNNLQRLRDSAARVQDQEEKESERRQKEIDAATALTKKEQEQKEKEIADKEKELNRPLTAKERLEIEDAVVRSKQNKLQYQKSRYEFEKEKKSDKTARSAELSTYRDSSFQKPDEVETPSGIQFFRQISLEPTVLNIPIHFGGQYRSGDGMVAKVGVKCIPYLLDDVTSIVNLLREAKNMNAIERLLKNAFRKINTKVWFSKRRDIYKGRHIDPNEATEAIKYTPNAKELTSYINLAKNFKLGSASSWSTMIVLSSYDIDDNDELLDLVKNYRNLTKYVFGDIIITNETKESAYFCTPRFNSCQELPYTYLSKVLNLSDVIDYSDASRASAWRKESNSKDSNVRKAISESAYNQVLNKVQNILDSGY